MDMNTSIRGRMSLGKLLAAGLVLGAAGAALADTSAVSPSGFVVTHRKEVLATPQQVFEAIGRIDRWWNGAHSYSGQASNLSLDLNAGGCFCERWDGGSVLHATVVYVAKGSAVRLVGGLGPLQALPVNAVLTFGTGVVDGKTMLNVTYRVAGNAEAGLDKLAGPVDGVIGEATGRLIAHAEAGAKP
jgi:hypothetical protein